MCHGGGCHRGRIQHREGKHPREGADRRVPPRDRRCPRPHREGEFGIARGHPRLFQGENEGGL